MSIVMPVHNTPRAWLSEALESVRHQFCDAWELICIDDGSTAPHVRSLIESYAKQRCAGAAAELAAKCRRHEGHEFRTARGAAIRM